jgi:hypothetical protein
MPPGPSPTRDEGSQFIAGADQRPKPHARESFDGVAHLGHFEMQRTFGGPDLFIFVAVAVTPQRFVSVSAIVLPAQELGHFEFDGFLEHELSTESNGLGERSTASRRAEELFLEELAGELAFHGCRLLSGIPGQVCTRSVFTGSLGHHPEQQPIAKPGLTWRAPPPGRPRGPGPGLESSLAKSIRSAGREQSPGLQ